MSGWVICASTPTSGVRHRFWMLSAVQCFAEHYNYSVCMLWGVTRGVAFCRFEELFAPIPGVRVVNILPDHLDEIAHGARVNRVLRLGGRVCQVFRPGDAPRGTLFSWDIAAARALARLTRTAPWRHVVAHPAPELRAHTNAYGNARRLDTRLGIRIRVDELSSPARWPRRIKRELNDVVKSVICFPWHTKVFLATDSEYLQMTLASHFPDSIYLPKNFDLRESTGKYVHRQDKEAMFTFIREIDCLCRCKRIINIGGFLNERSVEQKILQEPYDVACFNGVAR